MSAIIVLAEQVTFVTDPVSPCADEDFTVLAGEEYRRRRFHGVPGYI